MKFGTLQVYPRQGLLKEHGLDLPSALIGRGEGSNIHIDDFSISRRHARLTVDSGRLLVEDLGSAGGTFVDGERLEPGVRHLVEEAATLRFGEIEARYIPAAAAGSTQAAAEIEEAEFVAAGGLRIAVASPEVPIEPGKVAAATLVVANRGRIIDNVRIEIPDLPADWYTIDTPSFPILPGGRADVKVSIHPPRRHDSLAGDYTFTAVVRSQEYDEHPEAEGSFQVLPFESAAMSLEAIRSKRQFRLVAENHGNDVARYELSGRDDEQVFNYAFETPAIELQPGEKRIVALAVRRPRQLFGPPQQPPFEVLGKSASGAEISARGQLAIRPPLQKFRMPVMFSLAAMVLLVVAVAVLIITDGSGTKTASAEDPFAGVHLCTDSNAKEDQAKKNAEAANDKPLTSATVVGPYDGGRPIFGQTDKNGAPFFAQNDARWATQEYARSLELPNGKDWCGTTIEQCGCAMTSVSVMLALYDILQMPGGEPLSPKTLNDWFNGAARKTDRGWVSRGYIYGDVIWSAANELSGEIAKTNPNSRTVRFVRTGSGSEDDIRGELKAGRPVVLEVPGHWIAAVGLDEDGTILINDPFYRDRKTLDAYKGKVRSSVHYEPSSDLSSVVITAPADVKFKITDKQGRVVNTGDGTIDQPADAINQIPGASVAKRTAWRDPTCIEKAPPTGAGTNQVVLPGSRDDYVVEILGTGGQPGSIAIHTYGRDGASSIATIEGEEGTKAEIGYDPNASKPVINITSNGTPQATTTPSGGGAAGGDDETPTPAPSASPTPAPTSTPFVEQRTAMTLPAEPGQSRVEVATNSGFELGDPIRFAPGLPNEEDNIIVAFGSFILATPLKFAHSPGEPIARLQRPPGQGPGLPPGITPPPNTGPIEPPKEVTMACSTIYQPSPKQATLICDLTVNGTYTTTRWTLNGKVVSEFSGSPSLIMTFPGDAPANVSATVCNVTLCRSTSRNEALQFPPNGGSGTGGAGTGTGGSGTGTGVAPVPPAGTVVVTCGAEFPITPDGQVAQFNCQANFAGEFTSISWSAPGGAPANASGAKKTFTTLVKNELGSPVSLKVTATVCNFGVCRTSLPTTIGIGRTVVTLESSPEAQVNNGHRLTLMARVDGIGGVIPQGGTVQFFADTQPIGQPATLFTVGKISIAQGPIETTPLSYGTTDDGVDHVFVAKYSGGINAFGSASDDGDAEPRIITVLPPVRDGCDSVDEDSNDVIDDTCRNTVSLTTGFSTPGGYATPKNLGGGTVLQTVTLAGGLAGSTSDTVILAPGGSFTVSGTVGRTEYCPGCIRQVYLGIGPSDATKTSAITPQNNQSGCVANGILPLHTAGSVPFSPQTFNAPDKPGVYYLRATTTLHYFCLSPPVGPPETSVGRIIVQEPVGTELEIWSVPSTLWAPLDPNATGPDDPKLLNEIPSAGRVMLRVVTSPTVPSGRVEFLTNPPSTNLTNAMLTLPPPNQATVVLLQQVCPTSGVLNSVSCTPGEARLIVQAGSAARGQSFSVTARLETDDLELPTGAVGTTNFVIRFPQSPAPANNTKTLSVLVPSVTGISVAPTGDIPICAQIDSPGCTPLTLTANVSAPPPLTAAPTAGTVEFYWRLTSPPNSAWTLIGSENVAAGAAARQVTPGFGTGQLGTVEFQARFKRGTTNFEDSESPASDEVAFVRAPATAEMVSITPATGVKVDDSIALVASVIGTNGYDPAGGTIQFKVRPSTSAAGTDQNLGTPQSLSFDAGASEWRATLLYTTGADTTPLEHSGSYFFTAHFAQTATLAADPSDDFPSSPFVLAPQDPSLDVTLPGSGTITTGDSPAVVRVVITTAGRVSRLASNCPNNNTACGDIELLGTGAATAPSGPVVELGTGTGVYGREFSVSGLNAGTYTLTARYTGNTYFAAVTSGPSTPTPTFTVNPIPVDVTASATSPIFVNGTQNLAASVLPTVAPGTVQFKVDGSNHGSPVNLASGSASIPWTPTSTGSFNITAEYVSSSVNYASDPSSNTVPVTVNPIPTTLTVTAPASTEYGKPTILTADVVPAAAPGTVQFKLNGVNVGTAVALASGTASITWTPDGLGTDVAVTASYTSGSTNYLDDADSNSVPVDVTAATVTITISAAAAVTVGNPIDLNATLATLAPSGAPGTVRFFADGVEISGSGGVAADTTDGVTTFSWTPSSVGDGTATISATYASSSSNYASQATSTNDNVTINAISVQVSVSAGASVTVGSPIDLTAALSPTTAPGTVAFFADNVAIPGAGSVAVTAGVATFSWTPTSVGDGTATISAEYTSTSTNYSSQASSTDDDVTINPAATSFSAFAPTNSGAGEIDLDATVTSVFGGSAAIDSGTIEFYANGTLISSGTANNGRVQLNNVTLAAGTYTITAKYLGSTNYLASPLSSGISITIP